MSDTNQANDYATGDGSGPDREEIDQAIERFNTEQSVFVAELKGLTFGEYEIIVQPVAFARTRDKHESFDRLWEFEAWAARLGDVVSINGHELPLEQTAVAA